MENGEVYGPLEILRKASTTHYETRCQRCGAVGLKSRRALTQARGNAAEGCSECRNKRLVFGQLLTLEEVSEAFGIKKSLLIHRLGRLGMSIEDAAVHPVQVQNHTGQLLPTKMCPTCKRALPRSAYHKDGNAASGLAAHCKTCRNLMKRKTYKRPKE